jgi:hypothetical protein
MQPFSKSVIVVGSARDADVALPCERRVIDSFGDFVMEDFVVRFEERMPTWAARRRLRPPMRSMLASSALHATVLALAFFLAMHSDPKEREAARIDALRGYIARLTEQPTEPLAQVDAIDTSLETKRDVPGTIANPVAVAAVKKESRPTKSTPHGGGSGHASGASSCAAFANAAHDPSSAWIEFVLDDSDGKPVSGEPYRVTLPDGTVREGKTDARGLVCFTGVKPGNARIEWPRRGNSAQYVGASGKAI